MRDFATIATEFSACPDEATKREYVTNLTAEEGAAVMDGFRRLAEAFALATVEASKVVDALSLWYDSIPDQIKTALEGETAASCP